MKTNTEKSVRNRTTRLLLFAVVIFVMNTISAQETGKTITSPFGVARPSSASEASSDEDTFVDPETGEVGHIIRNPFGVASPVDVDTGIDIPDNTEEETGNVITNPFGTPNPDDVDTGVDVIDEDEEYFISLPVDEKEVDAEDSKDVDEVDDETSDDAKEFEEESAEDTTEEKYIPVKDNPIRGIEDDSFQFSLIGTMQMDDGTFSLHRINLCHRIFSQLFLLATLVILNCKILLNLNKVVAIRLIALSIMFHLRWMGERIAPLFRVLLMEKRLQEF